MVYPCVYREHSTATHELTKNAGLSLCIQGTHSAKSYRVGDRRFIPVYTGNTRPLSSCDRVKSVYPCVYREHPPENDRYILGNGLSLCIQGTLNLLIAKVMVTRFIPVYTGNTVSVAPPRLIPAVYPCVYREHQSNVSLDSETPGLSLCIQGTQNQHL